MKFLTNDKLVIVGAGGMIGSNMVQSVLMLGLTPNICLYDIYEPGVHGVYDEMCHCAFPGASLSYQLILQQIFLLTKSIIINCTQLHYLIVLNLLAILLFIISLR